MKYMIDIKEFYHIFHVNDKGFYRIFIKNNIIHDFMKKFV